jgi:hypothetical protein
MRRETRIAIGLFFMVAIANVGFAAPNQIDEVKKAVAVSGEWLGLIDGNKYSDSWDAAASYFKQNVGKEEWAKKLHAVRGPIGRVINRSKVIAKYMTSLPGAPDGEYVVIQYESSFENKRTAIETVTPMKDKDGIWRVSGYFIK